MTLGRIKIRISHNLQYISGSFAVDFNSILQVSNENPCKLRFGTFFLSLLLFTTPHSDNLTQSHPPTTPLKCHSRKSVFKSKSLNIRNAGGVTVRSPSLTILANYETESYNKLLKLMVMVTVFLGDEIK